MWTKKDQGIPKLAVSGFKSIAEEREIEVWVNPECTAEQPLPWLRDGAPPEAHRKLRNQP